MSALDIVTVHQGKQGWGPIDAMVRLAVECFEARHVRIPQRENYGKAFTARGFVPRKRGKGRHALLIAAVPGDLRALADGELWSGAYESVSAWVIDSFWDDRVPKVARGLRSPDRIWVADTEDIGPWDRMFSGKVGVLPWGTDALAASRRVRSGEKDIDLLRVGRQPEAFDDDALTVAAAESMGLRFQGRPPFGDSPETAYGNLLCSLERAKAVLAFSNLVDGSTYTHPTKEYVTGRWTDALAAGAVVVGRAPKTATAQELLPEAGLIDVPHDDLLGTLAEVKRWMENWTPSIGLELERHAREHLDWGHRFSVIAEALELGASPLAARLRMLQDNGC